MPTRRLLRSGAVALVAAAAFAASGLYLVHAQAPGSTRAANATYRGLYVATRPLLAGRKADTIDWARSPASGAYIRLTWAQVEPVPGRFDWSALDPVLDAAVGAGKKLSMSIITGGSSPAWLPGKAATVTFRVGKGGDRRRCTQVVEGLPWDPAYQQRYVGVMRALADHLRSRPADYAALRIVKMTAIAQNTEELRLPSTDGDRLWRGRKDPCDQSDAVATWRAAGYAPEKVVAGWTAMAKGVARAFPDKIIAQDTLENNDFPDIGDSGSVKREIVDDGIARLKGRFAVQWNGLTATGRIANSVVEAGRRGAIIGWQTNAFRGLNGAGCNADRLAVAATCSSKDYAAILARGIALGGAYIEVWPADVAAFPDAIRDAENRLHR